MEGEESTQVLARDALKELISITYYSYTNIWIYSLGISF
jgi:hypothetical protein